MIKKYNIKNQKGFSLIEMMVVVVILGLIVLGLVTFFTGGTKSWVAGQSQLKAQREARQAMDRMVREIREGNNVVTGSDDSSITVNIPNFDDKGNISSNDTVIYRLDGTTTIQRNGVPLIDNVLKKENEAIFRYFESSETEVIAPFLTDNDVSKIHINLKVDVDKDENPDVTLNTDVNLRNFGLQ